MDCRILVADDHALIRQGIRAVLSVDPSLRIIAEAAEGREAVALADKHRPDVAIIDIRMKELNGIDVIGQVARHSPTTAIIALSMFSDERYVNRALRAGAKAYVLKDSSDDDLLRAVRAVQLGQSFLSPEVARVLVDAFARKDEAPELEDRHELLSDREREVYQLLAEGRTNKMIADTLKVSIHTVETHRIRIMAKLDIHNMAELVLSAVRRGIVA